MLEFVPGYYQISRGNYLRGMTLFLLVSLSALTLLKVQLFHTTLSDREHGILWAMLGIGFFWHVFALALSKSTQAADLNEADRKVLYEKGRLAVLKGNHELAKVCFEKLYQMNSQDEDFCYQLGKSYMFLGEKKQAMRLFRNYMDGPGKKWRAEVESYLKELKVA